MTRATTATIGVNLVGFVILLSTSLLEHVRSVRPSTFLNIYFGISTLLDLARARTLFFYPADMPIAAVNLTSFLVKLIVFLLEVTEKRSLLYPQYRSLSQEATSGICNRVLFVWLNRLFVKGFRTFLTINTLEPLDDELSSATEPTSLLDKWLASMGPECRFELSPS